MLEELKEKMNSKEMSDAIGKGISNFNENVEELLFIEYQLYEKDYVSKERIDNVLAYFLDISTKMKFAEIKIPMQRKNLRLVYTAIDTTIARVRNDLNSGLYSLEAGWYHKV